jgi:uncharacterized membrane protein (UPF0127 family)
MVLMRRMAFLAVMIAVLGTAAAASGSTCREEQGTDQPTGEPTPVWRTIDVQFDGRTIVVEVADDPEERRQGLSDREALARDAGMLFVWDSVAVYTLWMKNMRFSLDVIWIDDRRRVVNVTADVPHQPGASDAELIRYSSGVDVLYAIELNAGAAERHGIEVGDVLVFDETRP